MTKAATCNACNAKGHGCRDAECPLNNKKNSFESDKRELARQEDSDHRKKFRIDDDIQTDEQKKIRVRISDNGVDTAPPRPQSDY